MIGIAFAVVLAAITPNPLHVTAGDTATIHVDYSPSQFIHGAGFSAEDPSIATVSGSIPFNGSSAKVEVHALREGSTRLIMSFPVGFSLWKVPIADIYVDPCVPPTIALVSRFERINEGEAVTLMAMTTGAGLVHIEWYEGDAFLGIGSPLTIRSLGAGTHRMTARALNQCGMVTSEEAVIEVIARPRRRRPVRHAVVTPNPIYVAVGETVEVQVENSGAVGYSSLDPTIALITGHVPFGQTSGKVAIQGVREGTTTMYFPRYEYLPWGGPRPPQRIPVSDVIVTPCVPPTLTFDAPHVWIAQSESVTVTAMTTGTGLGMIEWLDGTQLRGLANSMTFASLPIGTHRFTARVRNVCGVASDDVVIEVVEPRRRTVRH